MIRCNRRRRRTAVTASPGSQGRARFARKTAGIIRFGAMGSATIPAGAVAAGGAARLPSADVSPIAMVLGADQAVQAVVVILLLASVLTWTICVAKTIELRAARRRLENAVPVLVRAADIASVGDVGCRVVAAMVIDAEDEIARSVPAIAEGAKDRIAMRLDRIASHAARRLGGGMAWLAIIGATAPFVGLFGTVWGIMHSFVGIAEALITTAFGLFAAIPAVVVYNLFARMLSGYRALLGDASVAVQCPAGRDLDRAAARG